MWGIANRFSRGVLRDESARLERRGVGWFSDQLYPPNLSNDVCVSYSESSRLFP
jgi:hypothetical protein